MSSVPFRFTARLGAKPPRHVPGMRATIVALASVMVTSVAPLGANAQAQDNVPSVNNPTLTEVTYQSALKAFSLKNYSDAFMLFGKAADEGNVKAQFYLGYMYEMARGVPKNYPLAFYWLSQAANQGDADAQMELGDMYIGGRGVKQDYALGLSWTRKSADQGDARAQFNLGTMYSNGEGVSQDFAQALNWFRKSADQGRADAQYNLGLMYFDGRGVPQDNPQALNWFSKSAAQGFAPAQSGLGMMYFGGQGVPQDYAQALNWLSKSAAQGYAPAQSILGAMYDQGYGVLYDYKEALKWVRAAAAQDNALAEYYLGLMYLMGHGVPTDYTIALHLLNRAAAKGLPDAPEKIGEMYRGGLGVPKDILKAADWFRTAIARGNKSAQAKLDMVTSPNYEANLAAINYFGKLTRDIGHRVIVGTDGKVKLRCEENSLSPDEPFTNSSIVIEIDTIKNTVIKTQITGVAPEGRIYELSKFQNGSPAIMGLAHQQNERYSSSFNTSGAAYEFGLRERAEIAQSSPPRKSAPLPETLDYWFRRLGIIAPKPEGMAPEPEPTTQIRRDPHVFQYSIDIASGVMSYANINNSITRTWECSSHPGGVPTGYDAYVRSEAAKTAQRIQALRSEPKDVDPADIRNSEALGLTKEFNPPNMIGGPLLPPP